MVALSPLILFGLLTVSAPNLDEIFNIFLLSEDTNTLSIDFEAKAALMDQ